MDIQKTFEKYINIYQDNSSTLKKTDRKEIFKIREQAFEKFMRLGVPDKKNENYKYANIEEICTKDYEFSLGSRQARVDLNTYFQCEVDDMDTHVLEVCTTDLSSLNG